MYNFLKRYEETKSIVRKQGSGRLSKVTAEIEALVDEQIRADNETIITFEASSSRLNHELC